jgi:hypothetical protein
VAVDSANADARVLGDLSHRHLLAVAANELSRSVQHPLTVGGGVLAWLAFEV